MSEHDRSQQTEEATPRRQEKLREEGKVAVSPDVGAAAVLASVGLVLAIVGPWAARELTVFARRALRMERSTDPLLVVREMLPVLLHAIVPVVLTAALVAFLAGMAQTKGLFQLSLVAPKFERLDPATHISRVLPSKDTFTEILKQLAKISILGVVVYQLLRDLMPTFTRLASTDSVASASTVATAVTKVALHSSVAFALIAGLDYWLAHKRYREESRMSKKELRDELKEDQGDPLLRRRLRQRMRELARVRAVSDVAKATVVVTNPTHVAVALRYRPETDHAPVVIAKGVERAALQIRKQARARGVPIVENRPLARALHRDGKVGRPIPIELYRAVAEIVAHVLALSGKLPARSERGEGAS